MHEEAPLPEYVPGEQDLQDVPSLGPCEHQFLYVPAEHVLQPQQNKDPQFTEAFPLQHWTASDSTNSCDTIIIVETKKYFRIFYILKSIFFSLKLPRLFYLELYKIIYLNNVSQLEKRKVNLKSCGMRDQFAQIKQRN